MNIVHINSVFKFGSTGRIVEQLYNLSNKEGFTNYVFYGRKDNSDTNDVNVQRIGGIIDNYLHVIGTRITDKHGLFSEKNTKQLIEQLEKLKPDLIHLHNIHGYYINYEILFKFLKNKNIPVVWTLHDCWSFTGHCSHYEYIGCTKWQNQCFSCEQKKEYPKSLFIDNSFKNYTLKKELFTLINDLYLIPVSQWLHKQLNESFFLNKNIQVIKNGIDLSIFRILDNFNKDKYLDKRIILGVSSIWNERKGLKFFLELSQKISSEYQIIIVGLTKKQIKMLPSNIVGITRTQNIEELVYFYNLADVFINPTLEDTFPTTNIEALACGTPVITFNSGGSAEIIDKDTGIVSNSKTTQSLIYALSEIFSKPKSFFLKKCRNRAELLYDKEQNFLEYIHLYHKILNTHAN